MNAQRTSKGPARLHAENVSRVRFVPGRPPELHFSPDPKGTRPLWFYFRAKARSEEVPEDASGKLRVVLEHYETLAGALEPSECNPLFRAAGQWWTRMSRGKTERSPDGRISASWQINYPEDDFEIALGYPYEEPDLKKLAGKKDSGWMRDVIGLSRDGRPIARIANCHERDPRYANGLYLMARERGCDMPAAWVLDGLLQRLATTKKNPFMTWAIPIADPDALQSGAWRSEPEIPTQWHAGTARPEIHAMQADIKRWKTRCNPSLVMSIRAAELSEVTGIYCTLPGQEQHKEHHQLCQKWANVMSHKLGPEFASPEFIRPAESPGSAFPDWLADSADLCGLTLHIPWARTGETVLSPKKYRDAGRLIADALVGKRK